MQSLIIRKKQKLYYLLNGIKNSLTNYYKGQKSKLAMKKFYLIEKLCDGLEYG